MDAATREFVLDMTGFCKAGSPFQDRVYFILNYDYFIGKVGGVDEFKRIMLWLPAWHDAREILRSMNVSDKKVAEFLRSQRAVEDGTELLALYEMIKACLAHEAAAANNEAVVT